MTTLEPAPALLQDRRKVIGREELDAFLGSLQRLLEERSSEADVRRIMETPEGYDRSLWGELAGLGVVGLVVDEVHGGVGAGAVELERVMEAAGAALLCGPLLSSGVLAAGLLQALDDGDARARWLPAIADGSVVATLALTGPAGSWTPEGVAVAAEPDGNGWRLRGRAAFVTHAQLADVLFVVAGTAEGFAVFETKPDAEGVTVSALPTFDRTLRLADVSFDGASARRLHHRGDAWPAVEKALDLARVALAGEQAGGTRRVLEMTVEYAKQRRQFGRAIGGFQAIKHMAADMLLEAESAVSAARHAAQRLDAGAPDAPEAISLAAFACADAFTAAAAASVQMHGGVAFTWAHPAHLYLRRARADAQLLGSPASCRERYVRHLEARR